jgi:hypothetical protein
MLTWNQPLPGKPNYDAEIDESDPAAIRGAIVETWTKFLDGLDLLDPASWSVVFAYLVTEIGGVTLYPTTREEPGKGRDDLSVTLTILDWATRYETLADESYAGVDRQNPDAERRPEAEEKFHGGCDAHREMMANSLKGALNHAALTARYSALEKREGFAICFATKARPFTRPT